MVRSTGIGQSETEADLATLLDQLEAKYKEAQQGPAWRIEKKHWQSILKALREQEGGISFNYTIERVLGIGGAGAVFRIVDRNLFSDLSDIQNSSAEKRLRRSYKALKVPRPHIEKASTLATSLLEEISRLTSLTHPNIISLFAKGKITVSTPGASGTWPWFVMSYVHQATDLDRLCARTPPKLSTLVEYFYDTAKGLEYIHRNDVVHCDVKPANIFVTAEPDAQEPARAILADFGYAKHLIDRMGETTVGFTEHFAHPDLQLGGTPGSQGSRTFTRIPRSNVRPAFDLFALGITIHSLLERFYKTFETYRHHSYEMKYLKLMAARLLDGLNHQRAIAYAKLPYHCFADCGTGDGMVQGIKYRNATEVVLDFEKLLGRYLPQHEVPELIDTRRENIQVSDIAPVIYTERLRKIVDHPFVRRLASATQLGVVSLVYPGASHSRLEHSLGTMGVTAKYIMSLYNDTLDPLFRQLVDTKMIKATLLAALMHDIGQYPLAHDLEDVSMDFFSHEAFGSRLLETEKSPQTQGSLFPEPDVHALAHKLDEILNQNWGISIKDIQGISRAKNSEDRRKTQLGSHVERLCKSLIDGPIDADKVDYLHRDSRHCNVQYGFGIDIDRLFRCLTIIHNDIKDKHLLLVMGVHEKGRISAESILFARYAMLTQVYWHHTMRAIKALVHHAAAEMLAFLTDDQFESRIDAFFHYVILDDGIECQEWKHILTKGSAVYSIHSGDLRVLGWLWQNTTETGREAIGHLLDRRLFKRILAIYRSELEERHRTTLEKVFRPDGYRDRCSLRLAIERALFSAMQSASIPKSLIETQGFSSDEWRERLEKQNILRCLVDYPPVRSGASFGLQVVRQWGETPSMMPDVISPKESYPMIIPGDNFRDGMKEMEKSIACLRVFWRPDEYGVIREVLGDERIHQIVTGELSRFTPETR